MRINNQYLKVEGSESLVRDSSSHAILSLNDSTEYNSYLNKKKALLSQSALSKKNAEDIEELKSELKDIKELLLQLVREK